MTFEEWYDSRPVGDPYCRDFAERVWNAADRAAREECAEICDAYAKHNSMHRQHAEAAADCADEIREAIK